MAQSTPDEQQEQAQQSSARRRRRRKGPSVLGQAIGIFGGGFLGLAIGYWLLNYIGGPRFNFLDIDLPGIDHQAADGDAPSGVRNDLPGGELSDFGDKFEQFENTPPPDNGRKKRNRDKQPDTGATFQQPEPDPWHNAVRGRRAFTSDELGAALAAANEAGADIDAEVYRTFARLGDVVTFIDQGDPSNLNRTKAIERILERVAGEADRYEEVGRLAGIWLESPHRKQSGILLAGRVLDVQKRGRWWTYKIALASDGRELTVVNSANTRLELSDPCFILGSIIDEPAKNLREYEGAADSVVMLGYYYKLRDPTDE